MEKWPSTAKSGGRAVLGRRRPHPYPAPHRSGEPPPTSSSTRSRGPSLV